MSRDFFLQYCITFANIKIPVASDREFRVCGLSTSSCVPGIYFAEMSHTDVVCDLK